MDSPQLESVFRFPNAPITAFATARDDALFVVANGVLHRASFADLTQWHPVGRTDALVTDLYAASSRELFALTQKCNQVLHWTEHEGWREEVTPVSDSVWESGHTRSCISLFGVWGRGPNDVYVVGEYAAILHFDGTRWTLESNPLLEIAWAPVPEGYEATLWSVGGDEQHTYAAGVHVLRRTDGKWTRLARPMTPAPAGLLTLIVAADSAIYFGGSAFVGNRDAARLLRLRGDEWSVLSDRLAAFRYGVTGGVGVGNGKTFIWSLAGELAQVDDKAAHVTVLPGFQHFVGAALVGSEIVVAGIRDNGGEIAIIRSDSQEDDR